MSKLWKEDDKAAAIKAVEMFWDPRDRDLDTEAMADLHGFTIEEVEQIIKNRNERRKNGK
jgi:predicted lipoprotein